MKAGPRPHGPSNLQWFVVSDKLRANESFHHHVWHPFNFQGMIVGYCSCNKVNKGEEK